MVTQLAGVHYGPVPRGFGPGLAYPPRWIVIHDTGNDASASDEAHYAASRTDDRKDWTSAHFYVDTSGVIGSVTLDEQPWAAFANANANGWHIEMCGHDAGQPGDVPLATVENTARLVAQLLRLPGVTIPVAHVGPDGIRNNVSGLAGHLDFTEEEHRPGGHTDPGYRFDWTHLLTLIETDLVGNPPPGAPDPSNWTEFLMDNLPTLSQGASGQAVRNMQGLIAAHGGNLGQWGIDGQFGPATRGALANLQAVHHIPNSVRDDGSGDGVCGRGTWTWLLTQV